MQKEEFLSLQKALRKHLDYASALDVSVMTGLPIAPPITATIAITSRCNSDCKYCGFRSSLSGNKVDMDADILKRVIREMAVIGVKILTLTGGEPLLRKDLPDLCECAKDAGITVHITTNGLLLTSDIAAKLSECGVSNLVVSLDSLDDSVYSRHRGVSNEKVVRALSILDEFTRMKAGNHCAVTYVISRLNYRELPSFVSLIHAISDRILINIQPYHRPDMPDSPQNGHDAIYEALVSAQNDLTPGESDRKALEDMVEKLIALKKEGFPINNSDIYLKCIPDFLIDYRLPAGACRAGYSGLCVKENLDVLPCWHLPPVGNLKDISLIDLWFSQRYANVRAKMVQRACPRCMLLCHNEPGWYGWYNHFYQETQ